MIIGTQISLPFNPQAPIANLDARMFNNQEPWNSLADFLAAVPMGSRKAHMAINIDAVEYLLNPDRVTARLRTNEAIRTYGSYALLIEAAPTNREFTYQTTDNMKTYKYNGVGGYALISDGLALGETSETAYAGDKGNNLLSIVGRFVKNYNPNYNFKGFCIADQAPPIAAANDCYYYTGEVTSVVFGIAGVTSGSFMVYETGWKIKALTDNIISAIPLHSLPTFYESAPSDRIRANDFDIRFANKIIINSIAGSFDIVKLNKETGLITKEIQKFIKIGSDIEEFDFTNIIYISPAETIGIRGNCKYIASTPESTIGIYEFGLNGGSLGRQSGIEMGYSLSCNIDPAVNDAIVSSMSVAEYGIADINGIIINPASILTPINDFSDLLLILPNTNTYCNNYNINGKVNRIEFKAVSGEIITFVKINKNVIVPDVVLGSMAGNGGIASFIFGPPVSLTDGEYIGIRGKMYYNTFGAGSCMGVWERSSSDISYFFTNILEFAYNLHVMESSIKDDMDRLKSDVAAVSSKTAEPQYISLFEDKFSGINLSEWTKSGTWSISDGIIPSAIGNTTYIQSKRVYHSDKRFMRVTVELSPTSIFKIPVSWGGIAGGEGASCFAIDFANKKIIIYSVGTGLDTQYTSIGYTNTELISTVIPDAVIGTRTYKIELHKDGLIHKLILMDTLTGKHIEATHTGWAAGRQNDYYGFYSEAGTLKIKEFEVFSLNRPDIVFSGDSITEGVYVYDRTKRYAEQFRANNPNKKVVISARGGDTVNGILTKFFTEYNIYKPKILSVLIGANGGNTLANLNQIKSNCDAIGCTLILNKRTCENGDIDPANYIINQVGVNGARFDLATSNNNIPSTGYNPALYGDAGTHPNELGNAEIYSRLLIDVPEIYQS